MGSTFNINGLAKKLQVGIIAFMFLAGLAGHAYGAALTGDNTTAWTITVDDTAAANSVAGAAGKPIIFDQSAAGADTPSLTINGAGTINVGAITVINADNASDTADLVIGTGQAATVFVINDAVTGKSTGGASEVVGNDLDITVGATHGGNGTTVVTFEGNVDSFTDLLLQGDDANSLVTIHIGDGTNAAVFSGTINMGNEANTHATINLAAGGTEIAGQIDLSTQGAGTHAKVINMAAGSKISGNIIDTAQATVLTINIDGNAEISGGIDNLTTTDTVIAIDNNMTLTASGTTAITGIDVDINIATDGVFKNTGAKTVTAQFDGGGAGQGIIDIDANLTVDGSVGAGSAMKSILVADGATFNVNATSASTNMTLGSTASGTTGTFVTGGALTWTGLVDGFDDNVGTIDINHTTTLASNIGATKDLALVDIAAVTATISGNVSANIINFSADGTANFADGKILVGGITATTDGHGTFTNATGTAGKTLVSGNVGTSTKRIKAFTITSANSVTQTFGGDIHADAISLTGGGTAANFAIAGDVSGTSVAIGTEGNIQMAAGKNITAAITADGTNRGGLICAGDCTVSGLVGVIGGSELRSISTGTGGTVTLSSNWAATTTTIQAGGTLATTSATTMEGLFANAGTMNLGGTLTVTDGGGNSDISNATSAIIKLAPADQYTSGVVISAGSDTQMNAGAKGTITPDSSFTTGTLKVIDDTTGGGTAAATAKWNVTASSLATYALSVDSADLIITATAKTAAAIGTSLGVNEDAGEATGAAAAMFAGSTTVADRALRTIFSNTIAAGGAAATELAEQVQGSPDGLSATSGAAVASAGATVISVGSSRMAALRTGNAYASASGSGFNGGSSGTSNNMWMKPFASFGKQTERKSVAGYDADTYGIAIGGDTRLNAHSIVGLSFSYADTDVDGRGAGRSKSDISSYQLTAYGDYTAKDYYIEALVGYAYNDIDSSRIITATSGTATGATESNQFMMNVSGGMPMKAGHNSYFTPSVGLNLTHVVNAAYTETGAGALNLRVNPEDITIAKAFLGGRYHSSVKTADGSFTPEVRARLLYDMAGDDGSSTNTFTGGGAAFNSNGVDVVEFSASLGAGLAYTPSFDEGMNLSVNYDWETKTNYNGHNASFTLNYAF